MRGIGILLVGLGAFVFFTASFPVPSAYSKWPGDVGLPGIPDGADCFVYCTGKEHQFTTGSTLAIALLAIMKPGCKLKCVKGEKIWERKITKVDHKTKIIHHGKDSRDVCWEYISPIGFHGFTLGSAINTCKKDPRCTFSMYDSHGKPHISCREKGK